MNTLPSTKGPATKDIIVGVAQITVGIGVAFGFIGAVFAFIFSIIGLGFWQSLGWAIYMFIICGGLAASVTLIALLASVANDKIGHQQR